MDNDYVSGERLRKNLSIRKEHFRQRRISLNSGVRQFIFKKLKSIVENNPGKLIVLFPSLLDWNIPLFQRPQHIALNFAGEGVLYLYGTFNQYDTVDSIEEVVPGCFLVNMREPEIEEEILSYFAKQQNRVIVHMYSGDMIRDYGFVRTCLEMGFDILYEYIDELSPSISGIPIPRLILERHLAILENKSCYVVATADKLYNDILDKRPPVRCALVSNGVDYEHFHAVSGNSSPAVLVDGLHLGKKPVIGYFGALANWVDYPLLEKLAFSRKDWQIVLLGLDYDGSINKSRLLSRPNVHYLGPVRYKELPAYARHFNVSIIPFLVNEVTISTSPIKLFEYMAAGKPIVSTNLPECRKYDVVMIAEDHKRFLEKVEAALEMGKDEKLTHRLKEEARKHTWREKAKSILHLLNTQ
ncbi:glycosyltransferase family 1 protein [Neobacillus piezotolerans]|uniref:Glycosyltransferase family 1 protein n=1 Tax=Neobacillus piezotolerans TaxID=2259171 RepID=A0A3D8GRL2_9BACI|nr:glycosyltransferase [Neobacillus piezotolerans]RDU36716.1 glycosyltransferase family 1 protein [Neobacillus piezotolerans]